MSASDTMGSSPIWLFDESYYLCLFFTHLCFRKISIIVSLGRERYLRDASGECSWIRKASRTTCYLVSLTTNTYPLQIFKKLAWHSILECWSHFCMANSFLKYCLNSSSKQMQIFDLKMADKVIQRLSNFCFPVKKSHISVNSGKRWNTYWGQTSVCSNFTAHCLLI